MDPNLAVVCTTAFAAVFFLLALLALIMQLITSIFPQQSKGVDQAQIAAISSTYQALIPGAKVTRIEELQ